MENRESSYRISNPRKDDYIEARTPKNEFVRCLMPDGSYSEARVVQQTVRCIPDSKRKD